MGKSQDKEKKYIFSTSIDYSTDPEEFIIELYSPDDDVNSAAPQKIIHDFDELISFFENLDEDINTNKVKNAIS